MSLDVSASKYELGNVCVRELGTTVMEVRGLVHHRSIIFTYFVMAPIELIHHQNQPYVHFLLQELCRNYGLHSK